MAGDAPQKILLIHFGQLGDVLLALPAIKAVREKFPNARITALTGLVSGEIAELSGFVDEVIRVDRVALRDGSKLRSIREIVSLARRIRAERYNLVIDLHSLKETNILAWLSGSKTRLLAHRGNRSFHTLGNFDPPPPPEDRSLPLHETYMRVLTPLGVAPLAKPVVLTPKEEDVRQIGKHIPNGEGPFVGIFPGAGHPDRQWPLERFAEIVTRLHSTGVMPLVFLGPEEAGLKNEVINAFGQGVTIVDKLSLSEFLAAASMLRLFVTNDTGPMHLAALSGVPIVLVMDRSAPITYLPLAADLRVVNPAPVKMISVDEVWTAVQNALTGTCVQEMTNDSTA